MIIQENEMLLSLMQKKEIKKYMDKMLLYDEETYYHSCNVAMMVEKMLRHILKRRISDKETYFRNIMIGAMLHDIGKTQVPIEVIHKKEPLNKLDMAQIRRHPLNGIQMVEKEQFPDVVTDIILKHHERLDGSGYPCGYIGSEIGQEVKIVTMADMYCALTEARSYKKALSIEESLIILEKDLEKSIFDSNLLEILKLIAKSSILMGGGVCKGIS